MAPVLSLMCICSLYLKGYRHDLEIRCRGYVFKVDQRMVCGRCAFFDKATSNRWQKTRRMIEGCANEVLSVELNGAEDHPAVVKGMLDHLYGLPYNGYDLEDSEGMTVKHKNGGGIKKSVATGAGVDDGSEEINNGEKKAFSEQRPEEVHQDNEDTTKEITQATTNDANDGDEADENSNDNEYVDPHLEEPINFHIHVYAVAEKYDIKSLRDLACQKFKDCFKDSMLKPGFFDHTIWYVFNTTSVYAQDLREATMYLLSEHRNTVFEGEGFTKRDDCIDTAFMTSLVQALIHRVSAASAQKQEEVDQKKYKCPKCHISFKGWSLRGPSQYLYPRCPNMDCAFSCPRNAWLRCSEG